MQTLVASFTEKLQREVNNMQSSTNFPFMTIKEGH